MSFEAVRKYLDEISSAVDDLREELGTGSCDPLSVASDARQIRDDAAAMHGVAKEIADDYDNAFTLEG